MNTYEFSAAQKAFVLTIKASLSHNGSNIPTRCTHADRQTDTHTQLYCVDTQNAAKREAHVYVLC